MLDGTCFQSIKHISTYCFGTPVTGNFMGTMPQHGEPVLPPLAPPVGMNAGFAKDLYISGETDHSAGIRQGSAQSEWDPDD